MANAHPATEVKQAAKRVRDNGIPDPGPPFVALPTIAKHIVADKTANLVSVVTLPDGTVVRHYS
jgi:hypothetical protein